MSGPRGRGARRLPRLPVTVAAVGSPLVGLAPLITTVGVDLAATAPRFALMRLRAFRPRRTPSPRLEPAS
ncbi:hypothetical protein ACH40F_43195 [Streptomyces sp. NPDC020794]|uniref:hypothetical protein n=1 Tax=unclassified Streptomyces TaxID=2593676 RepID=UPI0036EAAC1A